MPDTELTQPQQPPSFGELFDVAAKKNFIGEAGSSYTDLMTYGQPVKDYKPSMEEVSQLKTGLGLSDTQAAGLSGALSPEELQYRAQKFSESNTNNKTLDDAGWKGIAAEALSYMADPVMLPAFFIKSPYVVGKTLQVVTRGASQVAVHGAVERAVGAAIVGGAVGLGQETALSVFDTERDVGDVVLAGLSGAVGGAAFSSLADGGAAIAKRIGAREPLQVAAEAAEKTDWGNPIAMVNESDSALTGAIKGRLDTSSYDKTLALMGKQIADPVAAKRLLTEGEAINKMIDDLTPVAAKRLPRGERRQLEVGIKDAEYRLSQVEAKLTELMNTSPAGSGKALAKARKAMQAEAGRLRTEASQAQSVIDNLRTTAEPSTTGEFAQAVSDISRLRQGSIPERLNQRYLDLITPHDAAPSYDAAISRLPKAEAPEKLPEAAMQDAEAGLAESLSPTVDKPDTSVGAAEVKDTILLPDFEANEISETYNKVLGDLRKVGEKIPVTGAKFTTSPYTRIMSKMKDNTLRGLAGLVFNDPHGLKGGPQSAIAFADTMRTRIMPKVVFTESQASDEYIRGLGINQLTQLGKAQETLIQFDREVILKINDLGEGAVPKITDTDDAITRAAKARAEAYQQSLELMKRYDVRGFADVDARGSYFPVTFGRNDMTTALDKYGEDAVREVIARGYMNGHIKLSEKSAVMVADNTLGRFYRKTGAVKVSKPGSSISGKIADVVNDLRASSVPDEEISTVVKMLQNEELEDLVSSRAMASLRPDVTSSTIDGLRMVDLIDSSTASVDRYVREASAQAAFARYGMRSRRQVEDTITESFKRHREELTRLTSDYNYNRDALSKVERASNPERAAELDTAIRDYERLGDITKYREFLDSFEKGYFDGVKATFGEPLEEANALNYIYSGSGKLVNLMLLGFSGTAQMADLGNVMARSGIGATLRNLPVSTYHGVKSLLPSQKYFMNNNELSDMAEVFGTIGHQDYLFGHKMLTGAEYGDAVIGQASKADKVLDNIGWAQSTMSFLRPMQGLIDELSARSLMNNIVKLSKDGAFTGATKKQFLELGKMSEESLDSAMTYIKSRMDKGDKIYDAIRTMEPTLRDELGTAIRTIHTSNINRAYYGELPLWTNSGLGKMLLKLQTFALVAWEKTVQRGLRHDMAGLVASTVFSAGLASAFIDTDVRIQSLKMPEDRRADYVRKRTEDERAYTIAGRMSQVAMFSNLAQVMNLFNPYEDSVLKPFGEYRGIAPAGAFGKLGQGAAAGGRLVANQSADEESDKYKVMGVVPLLNTATGMAILNTL
ncbi:internal virion protein C [Aeromonas phage vB_AspA_Tola]|nr:internal virion protein C [Aeromonas phage vB_AspA_Tola]